MHEHERTCFLARPSLRFTFSLLLDVVGPSALPCAGGLPPHTPPCQCDRGAGIDIASYSQKGVPDQRDSRGQRAGVYGPGCARVAWAGGSQDALHRAWVAVGERLASFNGKLRDELLDRELFYTLLEVRVLTERYRRTYNQVRPRNSLGYRPPAPEALFACRPCPRACPS